jgi:pimeloyl-ACP methyl ester carboxylesterase
LLPSSTLASGRHGPAPVGTATIGVKIRWSDEELARLPGLAERPSRRFDDEAEATDRFLKLAGLFGVVDSSDPLAPTGVVNESHPEGDWRAAQDPATVLVGAPDLASLLSEAKTSVSMALGDADPLVSPDHHNDIVGPTPHVFAGVGHNAMVEDPEPVARWFVQLDFVKAALAG